MAELAISASNVSGQCAASAALRRPDGRVEFLAGSDPGRGDITAIAAALCSQCGVAPATLTSLRLDLGPGSYVGLRSAVTVARLLGHYGALPVLVVDSLALLVSAVPAPLRAGRRVVPVLDARRSRWHVAVTGTRDGRLGHEVEPQALPPERLAGLLRAGDLVLAATPLHPALAPMVATAGASLQPLPAVDARGLFTDELPFRRGAVGDLEPLYLMGSYAEDG